jgi:hypothetical protein
MIDQENRQRLAAVVVEALEVGTGKNERDVIDDLFDSFGVDFAALDRRFPTQTRDRARMLRAAAADALAGAAPTATALLNEVVRCGGRFVAMVNDVYQRLARHAATTTGTNQTFRLQRAGVDEDQLTISPAFLERVRRLERRLTTIEIGRIDQAAVQSFLGWDNGELYGRWPPKANNGDRLADNLLHLSWLGSAVADRAASSAAWEETAEAAEAATRAAERVVAAAQWLVRSHITHLDSLTSDDDLDTQLFTPELPNRAGDQLGREIQRYRTLGVLAAVAPPGFVEGIDELTYLGLSAQLEPVRLPASDYGGGTGMSSLAGFVALWRGGHWATRRREHLEPELLADPHALTDRLVRLTSQCDEAAAWLSTEILHPTNSVDVSELLESVQEFLNLPLWRQRHLLYEVWVLCATLDACEQGGWETKLAGAEDPDGVWVLPVGASDQPVAKLQRSDASRPPLDVWREPRRVTPDGVLSPDVTVTTPAPYARDLVVVEAKDRQRMAVGRRSRSVRGADQRDALSVAERYAAGLRPAVTWVVNHCDYRYDNDSLAEHGTVWARIRLAAQFRPGNVPSAFVDTIRSAVAPANDLTSAPLAVPHPAGLLLVVDRTLSMASKLDQARPLLLNGVLDGAFDQFRAVCYADHGEEEPFLIRTVGPNVQLGDLVDAVLTLPQADGGDTDEALEDAMQRCRELVADVGAQTILVLTDAPAHSIDRCPYRIDVRDETRGLLDDGCRIHIAQDWLTPADPTWDAFVGTPGFERAPLATIISSCQPAIARSAGPASPQRRTSA